MRPFLCTCCFFLFSCLVKVHDFVRGQTLICILILNNLKLKIGNCALFSLLFTATSPRPKTTFYLFLFLFYRRKITQMKRGSISFWYSRLIITLLLGLNFLSKRMICKQSAFSLSQLNETFFSFSFLPTQNSISWKLFFFFLPLAMPKVPVIVVSYLQERFLLLHRVNVRGYIEYIEEAKHLKHMFTLKLFMKLQVRGWPVILLSRKHEGQRNATTELLISAGYRGWSSLIMRY